MTYFTSDLHLGHKNIISFCKRPFADTDEMDSTLIANWNSRVTETDDIYILGDLFYRTATPPEEILRLLGGRKHLIIGNHDHTWMPKVNLAKYFEEVKDLIVLKEHGSVMTLCHYPMLSWPHSFHGGYMIFGHVHNSKLDEDGWEYIRTHERMLNAGVDINGFYPVTFEEMVRNNEAFRLSEKERE